MLRAMKLFGKPHVKGEGVEFEIKARVGFSLEADGSYGRCYFCAAPVTPESDFAFLMVRRVNPKSDPMLAVCHGACAERARRI